MKQGANMSHKSNPVKPPVVVQPINVSALNPNNVCLYYGINDYPGSNNDLQGCVNDATDWCNFLVVTHKFNATLLRDSEATKANVVNALKDMARKSHPLTNFVFGYSGHGSNVADKNGDETDGRDECLCLYDAFLIDDEIRTLLSAFHPQAKITVISDSCHSGSVSRNFMSLLNAGNDVYAKPKFLPPEDNMEASIASNPFIKGDTELLMNEVLITGCSPTEFSYDARINGRYNGAMTWNALNILKQTPSITFVEFHSKLRKALPNGSWPQSPSLEGKPENKNRLMFV